jgi:hypothetical protein
LNEQVRLLLDSQAKLLQTMQSVPSMQLGQPAHAVWQQQQREPVVYEVPAAQRFQQSRCNEPCLTLEQQAAANTRTEQQQQQQHAPLPEGCCACRSPPVHHASPASAPPAVAAATQAAVGSSSGRSPPPPVQQQGVQGAVLLPLPAAAEQQGAQWQQHQLQVQQQVQEQHVALQDQATAIHGLKGVIAGGCLAGVDAACAA